MSGTSARRVQPRSNFAPPVPFGGPSSSKPGEGLTKTPAPSLKREPIDEEVPKAIDNNDELYSDPDEGVEIVDMEDVKRMDWMAPESLSTQKSKLAKSKKKKGVMTKESLESIKGKAKGAYTIVYQRCAL